jgi:predicted acylesterase/phospholipase RssA
MKTLFLGATNMVNKHLFTIVNTLKNDFDSYIGVGGSSVIASIKACKISEEDVQLLFSNLRIFSQNYEWDDNTVRNVLDSKLPLGNISALKIILERFFGKKNLKECPLGVVVYNMTTRSVEILRNIDLTVVDAIILSVSLPGFLYPTYFLGNQYIDITPINRFPIDIIPSEEEVYSIYVRSVSHTFMEEILTSASKPWQDIEPDQVIDNGYLKIFND